jgi:hypothetical protein
MAVPAVLQRIVDWLRAGYPEGVPPQDYFPVLALLARHLTDQEVIDAADSLAMSLPLPAGSDPRAAIADAIRHVSDTPPSASDISRVQRHLVAVGWPLEVD